MWPRLKLLLRQSGWWGIAFLALGALDLARRLAGNSNLLLRLAVYLTGAGVAIRLLRASSRTLLWRLRNRLIVAYLFMAVVPVLLLVCLVLVGGWAVVGQVAVHMVDSELERRGAGLYSLAQLVAKADPAARQEVVRQSAPFVRNLFPEAEMVIRSPEIMHLPEGSTLMPPPDGWKNASGLVIRDGQVYSWAHAVVRNVDVTIAAELTPEALAQLVPGLGDVFLGPVSADQPTSNTKRTAATSKIRRRSYLPPPYFFADVDFLWLTPKYIPEWDDPNRADKAGLALRTRASAVLGIVFGREMDSGQWVLGVFYFVAVILVGVEFYSLFMGIALTRTMTKAVQSLYEGTEHVKTGDFTHRIEVAGTDQLAELGQSFNGMTENLRRLILVEKEQERLQSELAIAREVQGQLFPRQAPSLRTLELAGVCHPARSVSGDYYDFIPLADGAVALAIGDVAGKGISAALLMASIQSIMRTQLTVGIPTVVHMAVGGGAAPAYPVAQMMATLNRQVYANTAPEKYATFCFGVYDESDRTLTYANAGHLPPILLRNGAVEILEVTGTVVGAFPHAQFEERIVRIGPGDLLATFTDGIVEPENEYGEAFGEERLMDLLRRYRDRDIGELVTRIMEAVQQWTGSSELSDDMTVLLARGLA